MQRFKRIFFDLDGTLTDSKPGIVRSMQYALRELGAAEPAEAELERMIGPPLLDSFERMLGSAALAQQALALYRERFAVTGLFENRVYDGIPAVLDALRPGAELFVATSKPRVYAERIVRHFGLEGCFQRVFGSELDGRRTDKGDLLRFALSECGATVGSTVMVGARRHDIDGARANGIAAVGVVYGYGSREELVGAGAGHLADSPEDIPAVLARCESQDGEAGRGPSR